jgi:hypothetical protein
MGYLEERERGCIVTPLDEKKFEAEYIRLRREELDKTHPGWTGVRVQGGEAFFKDKEGNYYTLCEEGVGSSKPISEENKYSIEFGIIIGEHRFSYMLSDNYYSIKLSEVYPELLGDPIDLADFIRIFGQRLNSNHREWVSIYKKLGGQPILIKQEVK